MCNEVMCIDGYLLPPDPMALSMTHVKHFDSNASVTIEEVVQQVCERFLSQENHFGTLNELAEVQSCHITTVRRSVTRLSLLIAYWFCQRRVSLEQRLAEPSVRNRLLQYVEQFRQDETPLFFKCLEVFSLF